VRDTGGGLVAQTLGRLEAVNASTMTDEDGAVRVRTWLDSPTYAFFQRLHVNVEVSVAPGFSCVRRAGPRRIRSAVGEGGADRRRGDWRGRVAHPHPLTVDGLNEQFWVHEETVRSSLPLTFSGPPGAGDHVLQITVSYQACRNSACLVPTSISLRLPVKEVALVGRELPRSVRRDDV